MPDPVSIWKSWYNWFELVDVTNFAADYLDARSCKRAGITWFELVTNFAAGNLDARSCKYLKELVSLGFN